jgi:hypothetical protein
MMQVIKLLALFAVWLLCFSCHSHNEAQSTITEQSSFVQVCDSVRDEQTVFTSNLFSSENITFEGIYISFDTTDCQVATDSPYEIRARPQAIYIDRITKAKDFSVSDSLSSVSSASGNTIISADKASDNVSSTVKDSSSSPPIATYFLVFVAVMIAFGLCRYVYQHFTYIQNQVLCWLKRLSF